MSTSFREPAHRIGLLFSATGCYGAESAEMLKGAQLAVAEINAEQDRPFLAAIEADPAGRLERYTALAAELLDCGVHHIVGCYTSQSRKEVIPLIEKHDCLLWYPAHYEGFEASPNVVYTGASPNLIRATIRLMREHDVDDDAAYDLLRRAAMGARMSVEDYSRDWLAHTAETDTLQRSKRIA